MPRWRRWNNGTVERGRGEESPSQYLNSSPSNSQNSRATLLCHDRTRHQLKWGIWTLILALTCHHFQLKLSRQRNLPEHRDFFSWVHVQWTKLNSECATVQEKLHDSSGDQQEETWRKKCLICWSMGKPDYFSSVLTGGGTPYNGLYGEGRLHPKGVSFSGFRYMKG